jgi:hypothetical protein
VKSRMACPGEADSPGNNRAAKVAPGQVQQYHSKPK